MVLNTKLAFEIWVGIVALIIVIAGGAGITLLFSSDAVPTLTRTQLHNPSASPILTDTEIANLSADISQTLLGGARP